MAFTDLSQGHQRRELMGRKAPLGEHPGPQAPGFSAQAGQQVAAAESQLGEPGRSGWRPGVGWGKSRLSGWRHRLDNDTHDLCLDNDTHDLCHT